MDGILFLILAIVFSSCVGMILKAANIRSLDFGQFMAVNYLVCTIGLLVGGAWRTVGLNSPFIWGLGIVVGFLYVLCLWLFHQAIEAGGLALSTTLMRLSAALPTMGSLIIFFEHTNVIQMIGIFIAFCCLPLASREPLHLSHAWKGMAWGMLLFAAYGLTDFSFKIQVELEPSVDPNDYMLVIFGTAMLLTVARLFRGTRPTRDCLFWGSALGATNMMTTYFRIRTLAELPGAVAFPTLGLGVIAVSTVASLAIWKETLRPANFAFLALASVAVLLINMG